MEAPSPVRGLFATDLDGTLLDDQGELPAVNARAIERAVAAGVVFAIATGRRRSTFRHARARLDGLAFRTSLSNGAVLLADDNERIESVRGIPWAGLDEILARRPGEARAVVAITVPPDPGDGEREEPDAAVWDADGRLHWVRMLWDPQTWERADEAVIRSRRLVHVALVVETRDHAEALIDQARACFGEEAAIHTARAPRTPGFLTEVVAAGGKGNAIVDLAAALGVPPQATAGIGDEMNDEALLEAAGFRFAVGGSPLALRRPEATRVATAGDGAVAEALDRFLAALGSSPQPRSTRG